MKHTKKPVLILSVCLTFSLNNTPNNDCSLDLSLVVWENWLCGSSGRRIFFGKKTYWIKKMPGKREIFRVPFKDFKQAV